MLALPSSAASDADKYCEVTDPIFFYGGPAQTAANMLWSTPSKYEAATNELHELMTKSTLSAVASDRPSSETIQKTIEGLQGRLRLNAFNESFDVPFADLRDVAKFKTLFLAVSIMRGGMDIPQNVSWLQYYSRRAAPTMDPIFSVANLKTAAASEARYLTWGRTIGDGYAVCKVRGYVFDGESVRTFYLRDDLWGGVISVDGNQSA